jgi:hypothetical protein
MSVFGNGLAMRRPTGMGNAGVARHAQPGYFILQVRNALNAARAHKLPIMVNRDATRVIPAIFQAFESIDQVGQDVPLRDGTDNSTHDASP